MKSLITILAGIVTHTVVFTYLSDRTTCAVTVGGRGGRHVGDCVMRAWAGFHVSYVGTAPDLLTPVYLIPASAGLLVGLILWAVWATR